MTEKTKLYIFLSLKALFLALLMAFGWLHLAPDEAQYWSWSQHLDWGYYSKPPAIAWQIFTTTSLLGNSELGVRFGALVIGFFLALTLYKLAKSLKLSEKAAFWSAITLAFSPLGFFLSFAATTDPGAILFFTLATLSVVSGPHYLWAGFFILLGALFKWTAFAFWPFVWIGLLFLPKLRKKSLIAGMAISLIGLLPSLYWNASHEWATFRHVSSAVQKSGGNFFDFLGAQIALLSPVFFVLLILALVKVYRDRDKKFLFVALIPTGVSIYFLFSLFSKMQPNWAAYLYPPGFALIAYIAIKKWKIWLHIGTYLSILLTLFALTIPLLPVPYKFNPFRQNVGWDKLQEALNTAGFDATKDFLFADKYQATSLLSYYVKPAYFFNISNSRKNQFSFLEQMNPSQLGKTGYFVVIENTDQSHYLKLLAPYFIHVESKGAYPLVSGNPGKFAYIFKATGYNGRPPPETKKY